jgi:hypothetical protein
MKLLNQEAKPHHYLIVFLAVLGLWYLVDTYIHPGGGKVNPVENASVDLTTMFVFAG